MNLQRLIQNNQQVALDHYNKTGHGKFKFVGNRKKEKLEGVICKTCKKFIGIPRYRSNKQRRR